MKKLKEMICEKLRVDATKLIIKRGGHLGIEIKNMDRVIHAANIRSGA